LDKLYTDSDAILLSCPLTKETTGLINDEAFGKMKDGVVLVNVARGPVVVDEALVRALDSGKGASSTRLELG
jgi:phosphoglycerate dehydrogenase-like enzyme